MCFSIYTYASRGENDHRKTTMALDFPLWPIGHSRSVITMLHIQHRQPTKIYSRFSLGWWPLVMHCWEIIGFSNIKRNILILHAVREVRVCFWYLNYCRVLNYSVDISKLRSFKFYVVADIYIGSAVLAMSPVCLCWSSQIRKPEKECRCGNDATLRQDHKSP